MTIIQLTELCKKYDLEHHSSEGTNVLNFILKEIKPKAKVWYQLRQLNKVLLVQPNAVEIFEHLCRMGAERHELSVDKLLDLPLGKAMKLPQAIPGAREDTPPLHIIKYEEDRSQREIEQECVKDYGAHKDNGGFLYGTCTRCGAHLG